MINYVRITYPCNDTQELEKVVNQLIKENDYEAISIETVIDPNLKIRDGWGHSDCRYYAVISFGNDLK